MDYMALIQVVLASMAAGGGYSLMFAISKINKGESFEIKKMARTVVIGGVIGVVAHFSGYPLTQENYQAYVGVNGFVVVIVDNLWAIGRNMFNKRMA